MLRLGPSQPRMPEDLLEDASLKAGFKLYHDKMIVEDFWSKQFEIPDINLLTITTENSVFNTQMQKHTGGE